jgi:signal transduction histidine kinase
VHSLEIAGFLSALAVVHATVAAYSLLLHPRREGDRAGAKKPRARADQELVPFGLLNLALVAFDGGLARAYAEKNLAAALLVAEAGRIGAIVFLVRFVLQYARVARPRGAILALYLAGAGLQIANAAGALGRASEARTHSAWILGTPVPVVTAPHTALGSLFAIAAAAGVLFSLAHLGRAFVRGRREAIGFVGMTLLAVAACYDALCDVGWAAGPHLSPFGYAAFVNGVLMTLLSRFASLRGQLEERARELKDRARALAKAYDELHAAQDELVRKEQLAAVGELSAVVAHEVRNPLAIISNAVATLRRSGVSAEDRETLLGILDEETTRLNRLVGDLLRYARPINLERHLVSLRELVERATALADGKVDLSVELVEPEPVAKVWADPNLLRQVFDNLVDNAIQAMSGGGVLTITLVELELDGVRGVEVQIQDTGEGMDTEVRARALDPFFTTRPSGTGLGLAIVARIVDTHGGVLRIKSKAGAGTVMHVFLPITVEQPPRARLERMSSEPPLPADLKATLGPRKR